VARRILLRLADSGDCPDLVRRRAPIDEVAPDGDDDACRVVNVLADRRLITVTRETVEIGDKAYSNKAIRAHPPPARNAATIPQPAGQQANRARRGSRGGRPPAFDRDAYKQRNTAERCVNKLKLHRAVATRYDKRDYLYRGTIDVASIRIWLRDPVP
jgi:transposase